jgi:hypothetical protein
MVGDMTSPAHPCVELWGHSKSFSARIMCWHKAGSDANDGRGSTVGGSREAFRDIIECDDNVHTREDARRLYGRGDDQSIELLVALNDSNN